MSIDLLKLLMEYIYSYPQNDEQIENIKILLNKKIIKFLQEDN